MSVITQFYLLQFKCWKLQFRKKIVTIFELLIPVALSLLIVFLRGVLKAESHSDPEYYNPWDISDAEDYRYTTGAKGPFYLAVTPRTQITEQIMIRIKSHLFVEYEYYSPTGVNVTLVGYDTEDEMVEFLTLNNNTADKDAVYMAGIVFDPPNLFNTSIPKEISYTIRCPYYMAGLGSSYFEEDKEEYVWRTDQVYPKVITQGAIKGAFSYTPDYFQQGFLPLQYALHRSIISLLNPEANITEPVPLMEKFPYPPYTFDPFISNFMGPFCPLIIMLSMIFLALNIPKEVTLEKQQKLKESMRMMGMANWLQWLSWFTKYFIFLSITTVLIAFLFCQPFKIFSEDSVILTNSDFLLFWTFLMLYSSSIITFGLMISTFFNKANAAAAAGGILFFLTYLPYSYIYPRYDSLSRNIKLLCCLDFNLAMSLGILVISRFEGAGEGVKWNNIYKPLSAEDNISFNDILLALLVDSGLYIIVMWYIEAVFPGSFGVPQPPYFFLTPTYWCGSQQSSANDDHSTDAGKAEFFESEPINLKAGIMIKSLTKKYKVGGANKAVVKKLNLNMYDGQITALLGHNGAGKTTTMFMLTGFIPPTSGTALVNGYDIRKDINNVRSSLGLCPQHDILFDNLTVEEHLYFFAKLKGCQRGQIKGQIDYYLKTLGIEEKRKAFASTLSGGQKRKLSVGIALIGDSKIVILDEPTSGMDPSARRHMWDVLQAQRAGRTMILSTHFMDEADHLGDRIAILADGVVQCCGSSLFLKKKYGAGYHMVMTKTTQCDVNMIHELLTRHVPEAKLESDVGAELSYILPEDRVSAFPAMFAELEQSKDSLGILGFGASVTTLEEVFMKVGKDHAPDDEAPPTILADAEIKVTSDVEKETDFALFALQFKAMFLKRVIFSWRNKILTLSQILLPTIFTALTILVIKSQIEADDGILPKLYLDFDMFTDATVLYSTTDNDSISTNNLTARFIQQLSSAKSVTLRKVADPREEALQIAEKSKRSYFINLIMAAIYDEPNVTLLFNPVPYHVAPTALLFSDQVLLHHYVNESYNFVAANHPLPRPILTSIESQASSFQGEAFIISTNLMFGFSFLAASFVYFLIMERTQKIKHSQIVSGVKWYNFWLSTFTWDFINFIIPSFFVVVLFSVGDIENFADTSNGNKQPYYLILIFLLFGLTFLPYMYAFQFFFSGPATGYVTMLFFNIITGIFPELLIQMVSVEGFEDTSELSNNLKWLFHLIIPNYNVGKSISNLYTNYRNIDFCLNKLPKEVYKMKPGKESLDRICKINSIVPCCKDSCNNTCLDFQENYLAWEGFGIGKSVLFLVVQMAVFWITVICIESGILAKLFYICRPKIKLIPEKSQAEEDEDVASEKKKVLEQGKWDVMKENQVVISALTKYFAKYKAVDNIYLAIPKGECFGLLGVNGAGKTTTFRMMTGDETISGGTAYMNGKNVRTDIHQVQKSIGYCPQFDALVDQMTGEEMLYMYARLRGIPESSIPGIVEGLIAAFLLSKHRKKLTKDYSGGNKRKLSTAIALMGDPPIVFLDEPTTGMDPVARRMLWQALTKVRESGKTLILTSHSMEECEALCTRMAIMVNGKYRCLGSTQHLKNKFGAGYTLIARVSYPTDGSLPDIQAVQTFVEETFPGSVLKDEHQNMVQYHIAKGDLTWATLFEKLEAHKEALNIEDYSISQTTLEQVFINFARAQYSPNSEKQTLCKQIGSRLCPCCVPEYVLSNGDE